MRFIIENNRFLALFIALLIVSGLSALSTIPRSEDPYVVLRTATIITPYPGASAERVEALVTEKIEEKLRKLPDVDVLISTSREGVSVIRIQLEDSVDAKNVKLHWSRARDLIDDARLYFPKGVGNPLFDQDRGFAYTFITALTWDSDEAIQPNVLGRYAEILENKLKSVNGTFLVDIVAKPNEEILVAIDSHKLASLGLTTAAVAAKLQGADAKVTAGQLYNDEQRFAVELEGAFNSIARIRQTPLNINAAGNVITLGDVANITRQEKTPFDKLALIHNQRGVVVAAQIEPNQRVDEWTERILPAYEQFQQSLPANVKVEILFAQNKYTEKRLTDLVINMMIGFILIVFVLLIILGYRSAFVVAASLPLTVLFTFTCMFYFEVPIHQISVTGLIVALGIMVDNAIVMTDTINRYRQAGLERFQAVYQSISHLWLPLLGSSLTTILAFVPIALMPGNSGEFVGAIAFTVIFSLIGSYIISHTLVAAFSARFIPVNLGNHWWQRGVNTKALGEWFKKTVANALASPKITTAGVMLFSCLGFIAAQQMTEQFFPAADRDMFHVEVYLPTSASITATEKLAKEIYNDITEQGGVESVHWFIGTSAPSFYYNLITDKDGAGYYAQAMVKMRDFQAANALIPKLQEVLDKHYPQAKILVQKLQQGPPFSAPIEYRLYGPDLNQLKNIGDEIRLIMAEDPDIIHTIPTLAEATPKLWVDLDEKEIQQSGLSLTDVSRQLQMAIDGVISGSVIEATEEIPIRIRLGHNNRQDQQGLAGINILPGLTSTSKGESSGYVGIPLETIASFTIKANQSAIPHRNSERINTIQAYLVDGVLPATVIERLNNRLEAMNFQVPNGYRLEIGGESEKRNDAIKDLLVHVGVIAILLILVIVLSFNSYRLTLIIFLVAIQAAGLGLLSVYCFGYPFGFTVIIALIGLIGLAINAAIVILAELKEDAKAVNGDKAAIIHCVSQCARHISSTTITTVGGFLPLILGGGGFWPPFAIAIAGGTLLTTLVSFYFVPALFYIFAKRRPFELKHV